jgi:hypothetical protein
MDKDKSREMQLKCQDLPNPSVFVTPRKEGGAGLSRAAANLVVITQMILVWNEQWQAFARVV